MFLVQSRGMLELNAWKKFLQDFKGSLMEQYHALLRQISVDLLDNEFKIFLHSKFSNFHLQDRDDLYDQSLILRNIIKKWELEHERQRDISAETSDISAKDNIIQTQLLFLPPPPSLSVLMRGAAIESKASFLVCTKHISPWGRSSRSVRARWKEIEPTKLTWVGFVFP